MKSSNLRAIFLLPGLLAACGDSGTSSQPDAAITVDASPDMEPDMAPPPEGTSCLNPTRIASSNTQTTVTFDTTDGPDGMRDLGLACGDPNTPRWSPQWVVEYVVPGTGLKAVSFSTVNNATSPTFDTVVQVRRTCERVPTDVVPPSCFDNASNQDIRSAGAVTVQGGETLYFFVAGYGEEARYQFQNGQPSVDRGPVGLSIQVRDASEPTLSAIAFNRFTDRFEVDVSGMDPNGDVIGAYLVFRNGEGIIDVSGDGRGTDVDVYGMGFASPLNGMTSWSGTLVLDAELGAHLLANDATSIEVRAIDSGYAISAPMTATATTLTEVSIGETCSASARCYRPLACESDLCVVPAPVQAACDAATVIELTTPAPDTVTVSTAATINSSSTAIFQARGCTDSSTSTAGPEKLFTVTVPEGAFDLIIGTDNSGTASGTDTVLYIRNECALPTSELAMGCNDDVSSNDYRSHLEFNDIEPGTYTIVVEPWRALSSASLTFTLNTKLRPVLPSGELCDRAQQRNRCATGTCPAGAGAVCP